MPGAFEWFTKVSPGGNPASGAVNVLAPPAVVSGAGATVPAHSDGTDLSVDSVGGLAIGDLILFGGTQTSTLTVVGLASGVVTVANTGAAVFVAAGTVLTALVQLYDDSCATVTIGNPLTSDSVSGRARAWSMREPLDATISGVGVTGESFGGVRSQLPQSILNVLDYDSPQQALDICPPGGKVYFPSGKYVAPAAGYAISKPIEIFGDLPGDTLGTTIGPSGNGDCFVLASGSANAFIHDLNIDGGNPAPPGVGIRLASANTLAFLEGVTIENVRVVRMAGGIATGPPGYLVESLTIRNCYIGDCTGAGISVANLECLRVMSTVLEQNGSPGMYLSNVRGGTLLACRFNRNNGADGSQVGPQLFLSQLKGFLIAGTRFQQLKSSLGYAIKVSQCLGGNIEGCVFEGDASDPATAISLESVTSAVTIRANLHRGIGTPVYIKPSDGVSGNVIFPQTADQPPATGCHNNVPSEGIQKNANNSSGNLEILSTGGPEAGATYPANFILGVVLPPGGDATIDSGISSIVARGTLAHIGQGKLALLAEGGDWKPLKTL